MYMYLLVTALWNMTYMSDFDTVQFIPSVHCDENVLNLYLNDNMGESFRRQWRASPRYLSDSPYHEPCTCMMILALVVQVKYS